MVFFNQGKSFARIIFILCLSVFSEHLSAQEKCGTVHYHQILKDKNLIIESESEFERFIKEKRKRNGNTSLLRTQQEIYVIPVVVHIIHNGEDIGTGVNLSTERILSQIRTLNQDYRRLNPDTILTPPQYLNIAADTEIEFVLARSDPEGLPTTGIVRTQGTRSEWRFNDDQELKNQSYWPTEDYLNIWVTDLATDLLGYAQFPVSNLQGMEFSTNNRNTDGVVIDYEYFGENPDITPRSIGRTTTHEVGHFLGLRHIWGDGNCDVDDFCEDTPASGAPNYTCNREKTSCGSRDMYENYMDYTDDHCMNLFTECQKIRMRTVLENSPRRSSLLVSPGLEQPVLVDNDAGIRSIISPQVSSCESEIVPQVEIINTGSNDINQVEIGLFLGNNLVQRLDVNVNLTMGQRQELSFSPLFFSTKGPHRIRFEILQVNNNPDFNPTNNIEERNFYIRTEGVLPLFVDFDEFPENWLALNPDNRIGWQFESLPNTTNNVALLNFYRYDRGIGQLDYLLSPTLDLSDLVYITLSFKVAYATFPDVEEEGLIVVVSKDCGNTFPNADVLYRRYGTELATAPSSEDAFVPQTRSDWRQEIIDLSAYIGDPNIQIAFIGQNGHGNNLYLDDVEIFVKRRADLDLNLLAISSPSIVSCNQSPIPTLEIRNDGRLPVNDFIVAPIINGVPLPVIEYGNQPIQPGQTVSLVLTGIDLEDGNYNLAVNLLEPNGEEDGNPEDNAQTLNFAIDNTRDIIPLRETFENITTLAASDWTVGNPDNAHTWDLYSSGRQEQNQMAYIQNFTYDAVGQQDWLVSPVLDFRNLQTASMFFSVAHAFNPNFNDALEIRVSTDCGETYRRIIYRKNGEDLSTTIAREEWFPNNLTDFRRESINLNRFIGEENVRIAFVSTTGHGNNLFLDNIEFFVSDDPEPVSVPLNNFFLYPNPATDVILATFNLVERQDVTLSLYDNLGRSLSHIFFPNTLNQTFEFDLTGLASGVYIVKFQGTDFNNTRKFIIK